MPLDIDSAAQTQLESPARGICWLVELDFTGGTLRRAGWPVDVSALGQTFTALGQMFDIDGLTESENPTPSKVTIKIPVVNVAMLAATVGGMSTYRGKAVRIYMQVFDATFQPVGDPVLRWSGYMEPVKITRQRSDWKGTPSSGTIELPCSRAGMARSRRSEGLRLTNEQQNERFPGDDGLAYVQGLIEQPPDWLSKKFQEI